MYPYVIKRHMKVKMYIGMCACRIGYISKNASLCRANVPIGAAWLQFRVHALYSTRALHLAFWLLYLCTNRTLFYKCLALSLHVLRPVQIRYVGVNTIFVLPLSLSWYFRLQMEWSSFHFTARRFRSWPQENRRLSKVSLFRTYTSEMT